MNELPKVLGDTWRNLGRRGESHGCGFRVQFTQLRESGAQCGRLEKIEAMLLDYFSSLALPDRPTIYDYLVLGLRQKDVIATFNWDPFLLLAHARNRAVSGLPDIRFLHGCVRYASCAVHDVLGQPAERCPICKKALEKSTIMFPHGDKDYARDGIIARDWALVTDRLKSAFHLTIFGYSGPVTDYKAKQLLLDGWKRTPMRRFSHVEIIDVGDADGLRRNWEKFIPFRHDMVVRSFWESTIANGRAGQQSTRPQRRCTERHRRGSGRLGSSRFENCRSGTRRSLMRKDSRGNPNWLS